MTTLRNLFQHHWDSIQLGDMDAIAQDYADDAILIRPDRRFYGHKGCRKFFAELFEELDGFTAEQHSVTIDETVILLEWRATHADGRTATGVDTFVIEDGKIQTQTLAFDIWSRAPSRDD